MSAELLRVALPNVVVRVVHAPERRGEYDMLIQPAGAFLELEDALSGELVRAVLNEKDAQRVAAALQLAAAGGGR